MLWTQPHHIWLPTKTRDTICANQHSRINMFSYFHNPCKKEIAFPLFHLHNTCKKYNNSEAYRNGLVNLKNNEELRFWDQSQESHVKEGKALSSQARRPKSTYRQRTMHLLTSSKVAPYLFRIVPLCSWFLHQGSSHSVSSFLATLPYTVGWILVIAAERLDLKRL